MAQILQARDFVVARTTCSSILRATKAALLGNEVLQLTWAQDRFGDLEIR